MTEIAIPTSQFAKDKLRKQIRDLVKDYAALEFAPKKFLPGETMVPPSGKLIGSEEQRTVNPIFLTGLVQHIDPLWHLPERVM